MEKKLLKKKFRTNAIVAAGMLTAISIILTRVFSIMLPLGGLPALRIGFGDVPIMVSGILFGPFIGGITGVAADIIGFMINPMGGPWFPGFTLSAGLRGILPGLILIMIRKSKIKLNLNLINTLLILGITLSFISVLFSKNVLKIVDGSILYNGSPLSLLISLGFALTVLLFIMLPVVLNKIYKGDILKEQYSLDKIIFIVTITYVIISLLLNTLWLSMMYNKGFLAFLPGRILTGLFTIPIHALAVYSTTKLFKYIES